MDPYRSRQEEDMKVTQADIDRANRISDEGKMPTVTINGHVYVLDLCTAREYAADAEDNGATDEQIRTAWLEGALEGVHPLSKAR